MPRKPKEPSPENQSPLGASLQHQNSKAPLLADGHSSHTTLWNMFFLRAITFNNEELDKFLDVMKTFTPAQAELFRTSIERGVDDKVGNRMARIAQTCQRRISKALKEKQHSDL